MSAEQLRLLPGEDPDELVARATAEHAPIKTYCLFSGGNDSTVVAHRARDLYDELVFIDTGTAVPGVVDFVASYAAWLGKPLRVLRAEPDQYRELVLGLNIKTRGPRWKPLGFPGPAQHGRAYTALKERRIEALVRETKVGHDRLSRVLFVSGMRRDESQRRRARPAIFRRRSAVFVAPLVDWTNAEMRRYRLEHGLPESEVAALLHRSGECNCGSFAAPGERDELKFWFPEWFETTIAALEREAETLGIPACRWGERPPVDLDELVLSDDDIGPLCSDCALRIDALA